jgi:hypothetical protein
MHAAQHKPGDAVCEGVGLAGSRAGDDQQRSGIPAMTRLRRAAELRRKALRRVEAVESGGGHAGPDYRAGLYVYPDRAPGAIT